MDQGQENPNLRSNNTSMLISSLLPSILDLNFTHTLYLSSIFFAPSFLTSQSVQFGLPFHKRCVGLHFASFLKVALFPGPAQLFVACSTATESGVGTRPARRPINGHHRSVAQDDVASWPSRSNQALHRSKVRQEQEVANVAS